MSNDPLSWKRYPIEGCSPNVYLAMQPQFEDSVEHAQKTSAKIPERMTKLIETAARCRPSWLFLLTHCGGKYSTNVTVVCDGETLGNVSFDSFYARHGSGFAYRFSLSSPAIRRDAMRKNDTQTDDDKKALNILLNKFVPTPKETRFYRRAIAGVSAVRSKVAATSHYRSDEALTPAVVYGFLEPRGLWEEFAAFTKHTTLVTHLPTKLAASNLSSTVEAAAANRKAVVLLWADGTYYLYPFVGGTQWVISDDRPVTYPNGELPECLRGRVGMLKVAPAMTLIPDVGMSVGTVEYPAYFILTEGVYGQT